METAISSAFEHISDNDISEITQGLSEIETILFNLCSGCTDTTNRHVKTTKSGSTTRRENYGPLILASSRYREFYKIQDTFGYNISSRLVDTLRNVLRKPDYDHRIVVRIADAIQGLCLLHYPSRMVFNEKRNMKLFISLLTLETKPEVQKAVIDTLVAVMVREVRNIRRFEELEGVPKICALFKNKETTKEVKLRILEFLFFYLIPETRDDRETAERRGRKTTEDKQEMLSKYLSNVNGLVREINISKPFGEMNLEW